MIKRISACIFALTIMLTCTLPAFAVTGEKDYSHLKGTTINVYNWGEYISDGSEGTIDVNAEFEKEYGIKVNYTNFDSNENMYNKLKSGGANYDVIIPSEYMIAKLISEGMLESLTSPTYPTTSTFYLNTNVFTMTPTKNTQSPTPMVWLALYTTQLWLRSL